MSKLGGIGSRQAAIALGGLLVVLVVIVAVTTDIGQADVPDDAVAVVDGDEITEDEFDRALSQAAVRQGLPEAPPADDPQYEAVRDQALNDLLDAAWILGEAEERGVEVSDEEVRREFDQTKEENFKTEKEYQDFLEQNGFTQEDIDLRVRLQLLSEKIQTQITDDADEVTGEDAEEFYEANKSQFEQPASRNIRFILNPDRKVAEDAAADLSEDNSPESWAKKAKDDSTDPATKDSGGVRQGVTEGSFDPALDEAIFSAPQGEVQGPIETPQGFYVFQVDTITEGGTVPIEDVRDQIDQQLQGQTQQEIFSDFLSDYRDRWSELTVCADDYLIDRCDNFGPVSQACPDPSLPEEQQQQQLEQTGCPPPVLSNSPGAPGSFLPFTPVQGQPQRPHGAGEDEAAAEGALPPGALPPGVTPGAAGGAQTAPPPQ